MGSEGGSSLPILVSLRRASQEVGERTKSAGSNAKRAEPNSALPALPSTRRPFEELLTALRKVSAWHHGRLPQNTQHHSAPSYLTAEESLLLCQTA